MRGPERGEQLGSPGPELLLHRVRHWSDVGSEQEGAGGGLGQYLPYEASS